MSLQKCQYCSQRFRFEKLHNRECTKRRNFLKRNQGVSIQEVSKDILSGPIVVMSPLPIEEKPKRKYTKKGKQ
jgi:hypothetical protein